MLFIKFNENTTPIEIVKQMVDKEAEIRYNKTYFPTLPKYIKPIINKNKPGWINFFNTINSSLKQLRP